MLKVMEIVSGQQMQIGFSPILRQNPHPATTTRRLIYSIALFIMLSFSITAQSAISWVATGNQSASTGSNSRSLVIPNILDDDLLIAHIAIRGNRTISTPTGWALIDQVYVSQNGRITQGIYYKIGAASDSATSVSWTFNSSDDNAGIIRAYRGIDTTSPIGNFSRNTANSATLIAPSINTTTANEWILTFYGSADGRSDPFSTPLGMTERYDFDNGASNNNGLALAGDDELVAAAGATGTRTTNSSRGDRYNAQLIALKPVPAPPVPVGSCDDFESGLTNWTIVSGGGSAGTSNATSNSPTNSLYLQGGVVSVTHAISYDGSAVASVDVAAWIQRGDDTISENPEAGDDLVLEYLNDVSSWIALETFVGGPNVPNTIYNRRYTLNADALHTGLKLRFRMLDGSGAGWDYWHVDDVCVLESDSIPPAAPTVNSQTTNDNTPIVTGTFDSSDAAGGFTVTVDGTTYTLGTDPELTNSSDDWTLDLSSATPLADGTYDVTATITDGGANSTSDTTINELTINASAPTITLSAGSCGIMNQVIIVFSEMMDQATVETATNYSINNGASIISAALQSDNQTVVLTTSTLVDVTTYTITVNNVEDTGGLSIAAGSTTFFIMDCGNLVAYYPFDEASWDGTADEIQDLSGNNLHGYSVGGVTTSVAKVCNGAILDGVTAAVAQVDDPGTAGFGLDIPNELTVSVWFKTNTIPGSGLKSILSKDENYEFHIDSGGHIYWWWSASTLTTAATISANTWHHVAIVYESGSQKIYIDGVEDTNTNNRTATMPQNNDPLQIGGDMGFVTREFDGLIDEVRVYSQAQNRAEILADMYASHPCTDPLVCSFRDNFASASYSNDDGSLSWDTDWQETNDNNNPSGGDAYISGGELIMTNVGGGSRPELVRQLDLTGATAASLDFGYFTSGNLEVDDTFEVQISGDGGGSWRSVYTLSDDDVGVQTIPFLGSELTNNAQIKLLPTGGYTGGGEQINLYYIAVLPQGLCGNGPDHYELSMLSEDISCLSSTVTVTACADSTSPCTNPATSLSGQTATLATTAGSLGATSVAFDASGVATTTLSYPTATDGDVVTVTLSGESSAATNPRQCCPDGASCSPANNCDITFKTAGFIFSTTSTGGSLTYPPVLSNTAGVDSTNYYLRAIKTATTTKACEALLTGAQSVDVSYSCADPATCSPGNLMTISGTTFTGTSGTPSLTFDADGAAPFTMNFMDVGRIGLSASKSGVGGTTLTGTSASAFVIKPYSLALTDIKQSAAPQTANPAAADASGSRFIAAGEAFSVTVTAVNASCAAGLSGYTLLTDIPASCITPNYGKESSAEGVTLSNALVGGLGLTANPVLNNPTAFGSFSNGSATGTTFSWDEVGIITLTPAIGDGDYLGGGSVTGTTSPNVGRFIPAGFNIAVASNGSFANTHLLGATPFTYLGEAFNYTANPSFTITAINSGGGTTTNYTGNFNFLGLTEITLGYPSTDGTQNGTDANPLAVTSTPGTHDLTDNGNGTLTLTLDDGGTPDSFTYNRALGLVTPFTTDLTISLSAINETNDGATYGGTTTVSPVGNLQRFGRATLSDVYGATESILSMPFNTEFYDGTDWLNNSDDSTTAISVIGGATCTPNGFTCSVDGVTPDDLMVTGVNITPGNSFTLTPTTAITGDALITLTSPNWLQFDWDGDGTAEFSSATATFGIYRGDDRFYYWREER